MRGAARAACIIVGQMSRVPNNRRTAAAIIRSTEGMPPQDAPVSGTAPATADVSSETPTAHETVAPPEASAPPPSRDEIGPRYESLVVYPTASAAASASTPTANDAADRDADQSADK